ncbi:hypothetical protein PVAP13_7NG160934 [Panicum virgatum]|uniref:Uncharacterized protein n=1 Tax=Panicum virgatum TaxID=38727 RepID=A0A8T0PW43_PANVG|nr:hypothetical protein PVAP13_7NG160934 [Panicum virgatum]
MSASSSFDMPLTEWRHYLQDINFWPNGYINSPAYHNLEEKLVQYYMQ